MKNKLKQILTRILPNKLLIIYRFLKKQLRFAPKDEQIYFDTNTIYTGTFNTTYRGILALRCPFDYLMYQMIICSVRPDLVIDIGTNIGGGALYMADLMNIIDHGIIHTIDIKKQSDEKLSQHSRIKLFIEGWEKYDIKNTSGFSKILVIDDASHIYEDTLGAMRKFAPLVSIGSYFIVEDGIVDELRKEKGFNGGPLRAIREFMKENKNFEVDRKYCDMFGKNATFNVNGYLKRIK